jgi:DNA transposition AAA+ family ATPase
VGDSWTRKTLLQTILREFGEVPKGRHSIADLAQQCSTALGNDSSRVLIIDEADKLVDKGMIEIVRELQEASGTPVILIGEEKLPTKLLAVERIHNRVLHWFAAQPCDIEDTALLAAAFAPRIDIAEDLLDHIRQQSGGRARRIVVNLARVAEFCRNQHIRQIDLKKWGGHALYTGEPPAPRAVVPFAKPVKAVA